jgi:hypothetical protein
LDVARFDEQVVTIGRGDFESARRARVFFMCALPRLYGRERVTAASALRYSSSSGHERTARDSHAGAIRTGQLVNINPIRVSLTSVIQT